MNELNIPWKTLWRVVAVIAIVVFILAIRDIFVTLFFAVIISSAITPTVSRLARLHIPRTLGAALIYLVFFGALGALLSAALPPLAHELKSMVVSFREDPLFFGPQSQTLSQLFISTEGALKRIIESFTTQGGSVFAGLTNILGGVVSIVLVLVISFYLTVKDEGIKGFVDSLLPEKHRAPVSNLIERTQRAFARWLTGQLSLGLIVGVMVFVGLFILGNPFALSLAVIAGIFELVPFIGPILSAVPGLLVAFSTNPGDARWLMVGLTAAVYIIVQQLENHLIVPMVMRKAVDVDPLLILLTVIIGAKIGGITGVILAVPFVALVSEYLKGSTGVSLKLRRHQPK